jgi:hypothetical protein
MSRPGVTSTRLSGAAGTQKDAGEPYRVAVRFLNGDLAYNATGEQESALRAAGLVSEVRSPKGILRYLCLRSDHRLLRPDPMLAHIITTSRNQGLVWGPRLDRAHTGHAGKTSTVHLR